MERVINMDTFSLIGINNRDLKSFETNIKVTKFLEINRGLAPDEIKDIFEIETF